MSGLLETNNIFKILAILAVLTILILYLVGLGYSTSLHFKGKNFSDYTKTQQSLMKMSSILSIIIVSVCVLYVVYRLYDNGFFKSLFTNDRAGLKSLAEKAVQDIKNAKDNKDILQSEKMESAVNESCDNFFTGYKDPVLKSQYDEMKSKQPTEDSINKCRTQICSKVDQGSRDKCNTTGYCKNELLTQKKYEAANVCKTAALTVLGRTSL